MSRNERYYTIGQQIDNGNECINPFNPACALSHIFRVF